MKHQTKTIKGITFEYGEERTKHKDIGNTSLTRTLTYYCNPSSLPTYWAIIQLDSKGNCKSLNCAIRDRDGNIIQQDPLYNPERIDN